jgi:rod shape-determining protein MreC
MTSLWDQLKDWVLVSVLLAVSLGVMFAQNQTLVRAVRAGALETTARIESAFAWVGHYLRALDENQRLRRENVTLAAEVARSREARLQNQRLEAMLNLRDTTNFTIEPVRIVSKSLTEQQSTFTINAGSEDSVETGMPVIDGRGSVLGRTELVSESYSRVMSYLHTDFRLPAKIQSLDAEGIVHWTGDDRSRLLMERVVQTNPVLPGQRVVTSGSSGFFPPGLSVGFVDSVATSPGRNEYNVQVVPSSPLDEAGYAFVVLSAARSPEGAGERPSPSEDVAQR